MPNHNFHVSKAEQMHSIPQIRNTEWDIVLAADVVEHVSNLGGALDAISLLMKSTSKLLVTTPSAFSLKRFLAWTFAGGEHVHPDHCYYFSPSTMREILRRSSLQMEEYGFFMWKNEKTINRVALLLSAPLNRLMAGRFADELAIVCSRKQTHHPLAF
jgi:predicted TPR repeat methyltransferase